MGPCRASAQRSNRGRRWTTERSTSPHGIQSDGAWASHGMRPLDGGRVKFVVQLCPKSPEAVALRPVSPFFLPVFPGLWPSEGPGCCRDPPDLLLRCCTTPYRDSPSSARVRLLVESWLAQHGLSRGRVPTGRVCVCLLGAGQLCTPDGRTGQPCLTILRI